jgi:hypothetical protein
MTQTVMVDNITNQNYKHNLSKNKVNNKLTKKDVLQTKDKHM